MHLSLKISQIFLFFFFFLQNKHFKNQVYFWKRKVKCLGPRNSDLNEEVCRSSNYRPYVVHICVQSACVSVVRSSVMLRQCSNWDRQLLRVPPHKPNHQYELLFLWQMPKHLQGSANFLRGNWHLVTEEFWGSYTQLVLKSSQLLPNKTSLYIECKSCLLLVTLFPFQLAFTVLFNLPHIKICMEEADVVFPELCTSLVSILHFLPQNAYRSTSQWPLQWVCPPFSSSLISSPSFFLEFSLPRTVSKTWT